MKFEIINNFVYCYIFLNDPVDEETADLIGIKNKKTDLGKGFFNIENVQAGFTEKVDNINATSLMMTDGSTLLVAINYDEFIKLFKNYTSTFFLNNNKNLWN